MKHLFICLILSAGFFGGAAQRITYPSSVNYFALSVENQQVKMAYMDVHPSSANGQTVLLLHGKNFNGYYWKDVIAFLTAQGFRVIVPDQIGFGRSDKPNVHYSFSMLAANTKKLLDSLRISKVNIICHSMGGMLGTRFSLMYPELVNKLIYENPIGLEDYRTFVPYRTITQQFADEQKADYNALRNYQQTYYPVWKPEYEQYVLAQQESMQIPDSNTAAWASALTYDMIYQQPVVYEFSRINLPVLIIIGQADRTIVGKKLVPKDKVDQHGQYPQLGRRLNQLIAHSKIVELAGVGHIPHIQSPVEFRKAVLGFLL